MALLFNRHHTLSLATMVISVLFLEHQSFAQTVPPGLNTQPGNPNLSIAVENSVGLTLSTPPANSPPGTAPNVAVPGTLTLKYLAISDQKEAVGTPCGSNITLGMLAESSTGALLSCQSVGGQLVWAAVGGSPLQTWYSLYDLKNNITSYMNTATGSTATRNISNNAGNGSTYQYTNNTSDPISVSVGFYARNDLGQINSEMQCTVNGVEMGDESIYNPGGVSNTLANTYRGQSFFVVPPGGTYSCLAGGADGAVLAFWAELRDSPP